jgi:hypothetical protein
LSVRILRKLKQLGQSFSASHPLVPNARVNL